MKELKIKLLFLLFTACKNIKKHGVGSIKETIK